jgi:hypothetical protein
MSRHINRLVKDVALNSFDCALTRCVRDVQEHNLSGFFRRVAPVATEHELIRIGNDHDGGYLVPDDLVGIRSCFSPGVADMADFELALAGRGIRCYLADYSVESAPAAGPLITFEKKFLGGNDDDMFMTLSSWVTRCAHPQDNDLLLQMDIEGAEYDVLIDTPQEVLRRFRIIVVEFHCLEALFTPMGFRLINGTITKLLRSFRLVHIHPNNCLGALTFGRFQVPPVVEFTFHRADRIARASPATLFPHPLDRANLPSQSDVTLPACWRAAG